MKLQEIAKKYIKNVNLKREIKRRVFFKILIYVRFVKLWNNRLLRFGPKKLLHAQLNKMRQWFSLSANVILKT